MKATARGPAALAIFSVPAKASRAAVGLAVAALIFLAPALVGCGKKNAPVPPPGVPNTYPLPYPRE